ncbi:uncharacterized protein LOC111047436 isoform X3 [Nilaparvata lugens]|uniref:uncharacterized protein LOC111047436 isoform X3 n=1 Tax=Nilaparvata lugens TaxID=108931 RepID=UPI00193EA80B|nr:uncharacterized protein LOC111047436 isoform X3 [Nilaparvata lugens]
MQFQKAGDFSRLLTWGVWSLDPSLEYFTFSESRGFQQTANMGRLELGSQSGIFHLRKKGGVAITN